MNKPAEEKVVLTDDFNDHIGVGNDAIELIRGGFGSGDLNTRRSGN